jgi:8-oxo-dGTP pyrophosphatase MutT (NUDIX family)
MAELDSTALQRFLENLRTRLIHPEQLPLPPNGARRKAAAVLVPLIRRQNGLHVLYTRRSDRLVSHRGQVAFPGGRFDQRDAHLLAAALRETEEEIGVTANQIQVLGSFEGHTTRSTEIFVTPFVGIIQSPFETRPDPKEVAEIFEVPLEALDDRRYRGNYRWTVRGAESHHPAILYGGQTIWGLTYNLTLKFLELGRAAANY